MARPKMKTNAEVRNAYAARTYDRIMYQARKDGEYNKAVLQAAADQLTGGSVTALINAALANYLPRALGDDLEAVKAAGRARQEQESAKK